MLVKYCDIPLMAAARSICVNSVGGWVSPEQKATQIEKKFADHGLKIKWIRVIFPHRRFPDHDGQGALNEPMRAPALTGVGAFFVGGTPRRRFPPSFFNPRHFFKHDPAAS
jgi:hypothetical protein